MGVLRWLAFFVIGDLAMVGFALAFVLLIVRPLLFLGALWDAGLDVDLAIAMDEVRSADRIGALQIGVLSAFLAGLIGAFTLANEAGRQESWRFWEWRQRQW